MEVTRTTKFKVSAKTHDELEQKAIETARGLLGRAPEYVSLNIGSVTTRGANPTTHYTASVVAD